MLDDIDGLLTENRIFKQRNADIGVVTEQDILDWGFSGRHGARLGSGLGPAARAAL